MRRSTDRIRPDKSLQNHHLFASCVLAVATAAILAPAVMGGVTHIDIEEAVPYAGGHDFERIGAYERLRGRVRFAVDPDHSANTEVVDLEFAPRNAAGLVEFSADLEILAPVDLEKANGAVLYDVNNRGKRMCLDLFNTGAEHFLMRRGYIVVWSGWIAEVLPSEERLRLSAPVANRDGEPIRGRVRAEMVTSEPAIRLNVSNRPGMGSYRPTRENQNATLTWRLREQAPRVPIPRDQWSLEVEEIESLGEDHPLPRVEVFMPAGFRPGYIYELIYQARDPVVQGLGLAGIRDLISFLKYHGSERNPLLLEDGRPAIRRAIGFGISQSGRCLRMFLYRGFNADENGRPVFEGLIPHVSGGGLGFFNHRFASPTRYASQHTNHLFPCDLFPFGYGEERDPLSGRQDGLLRRARAQNVVPKIFHVQTSAEYWHRSGSLVHTDPLGRRDADIPPEVRIYAVGGAQHAAGSGKPGPRGEGQLRDNPTDYRPILRALLVALEAWIRDGKPPPPSRYPRIADGTLVDWRAEHSGWKPLPGIRYPEVIQQPEFLDYGPEFLRRGRITRHPPVRLSSYRVLVPAHGSDNNERGMLLLPSNAVPVATYTGWNLRHRRVGAENELLRLKGAYIPFARTAKERRAAGDPRPALLERYGDFDGYLERFDLAARKLIAERYLLQEDLALLLGRARERQHSTIVVLVDQSLSMDIADKYSDDKLAARLADFFGCTADTIQATTRYDLLRRLFRSTEIGLLENLRRMGNVVVFSFARGIQRLKEIPPFLAGDPLLSLEDLDFLPSYDELRAEERVRQSRLSDALVGAVMSVMDETFGGGESWIRIVLISDGRQTAGNRSPQDTARRLGQRNYKVYTVGVGSREANDIRVTELEANDVVLRGDRAVFEAVVSADGFEGERVRVELKLNGSIADTRYLVLEGGRRQQPVRLEYRPLRPGDFVATVEVEPLRGELFVENNIVSKPLRVLKQKVKVLYVEGHPRWEYRYLRNILIGDPTMEARTFLFSADEKFIQESSPNVLPLRSFPRTRAELFGYHVIVIGDVAPEKLGKDLMKLLKKFVEEGGGLIFIAGPSANPSGYLHTDLHSLLPVEVPENDLHSRNPVTAAFNVELTTTGREHRVMRLVDDPEQNIRLWENPEGVPGHGLPGFFWFAEVGPKKGGPGVILARHPARRDPVHKEGLPIFAFMKHGKGKAFFSAVDETWRWRAGTDHRHFQGRFWGQLVRFVAGGALLGETPRLGISTDKFRYGLGETVIIECRVFDGNMEPSTEPTVSVYKLARSRASEPPEKLELKPGRQSPGTYYGSTVAGRVGLHDLWLGTEGDRLASWSFHVKVPLLEMAAPRRNQRSLEEVAELSGGRHFELHEVSGLVESLER